MPQQVLNDPRPAAPTANDPEIALRDELWKVGHFARVGNGSTPDRGNTSYWAEGTIPWLNSSVVNEPEVTKANQWVTDTAVRECHLPLVPAGSVLVGITGEGKTRGQAVVLSIHATVSQHLAYITPDRRRVDPRYLRWALAAAYSHLRSISDDYGGTKSALTCEDIRSLKIVLPSLTRQRAVVAFLDRESASLGTLIAAKERLLKLLAEKRQAAVTNFLMEGLYANVPLSDSGVLWLGALPRHWSTQRLAWLFRERDERGQPDLPLLEVSIASGVVRREFSDERIETTASDFNSYKVARAGDVVFNKMRMWQGAVGIAPEDGLVSPDYVVAEPTGGMSPAYAGHLFRTNAFSAECGRRSHGIVWDRLRLYWEEFRDIAVPVPPREEQAAIVDLVTRRTAALDALADAARRSIALLEERRRALITAAVTGQINIPPDGVPGENGPGLAG